MELKPFIKHTVRPGEPLTAQAWNDVVEGIDGAYQFLQARMHVVRVRVAATASVSPAAIRVVAVRTASPPVEAVGPTPPGTEWVLAGLEPGDWNVSAEASGFTTASKTVTVGADAIETTLELSLEAAMPFMPDLFGMTLAAAAKLLAERQIPLLQLFDFTGRELPPTAGPTEDPDAPVFVQSPEAGTPIAPGKGAALIVAVPVPTEPVIEIPSLSGLTQAEAQKALESVGLVLGKVTVLARPTP